MDLPKLRADQLAIARHPAKTKVLSMGRRWGKTVLGGTVCGLTLAQHGRVAWIAPTYKNTRPMWRWLLLATATDVKAKLLTVNRSDRTIETNRGGFLGIFSGDNIDSIRGEAFHLAVVDEAARIPETAWSDAIMPTLADYGGDAIEIGFNVTYLMDALSNMTQDMVRIELQDANSSALVTNPENNAFKYVVMPMRI